MMHKKLQEQIAAARFISFDMFDTLIMRAVRKPTDLFHLIEKAAAVHTNSTQIAFTRSRIVAEQLARDELTQNKQKEDITLDEIYGKFAEFTGVSAVHLKELKELEIKLETAFCLRNDYLYDIYKHCLALGKEVIIISDMYLPEEVIKQILHNNGYDSYRKLYLSSTLGLTKSTGNLFRHVREDLSCPASAILHVGDHPVSDVKRPREAGHPVHYYQKSLDYVVDSKAYLSAFRDLLPAETVRVEESIFLGLMVKKLFTNRKQGSDPSFWYLFGYEAIGILYYGFVDWLRQQAKKDGVKQLFFLARDGHIMKRVYDVLSSEETDDTSATYLFASRRAFNVPAITELTEESLAFLLSYSRNLTVAQYLERVGLNPLSFLAEIQEAGFNGHEAIVENAVDKAKIKQLYLSISTAIIEVARRERNDLVQYLQQAGFLQTEKKAIVDIGWHGSMQQSIQKVLELVEAPNPKVQGYYLGTFKNAQKAAVGGAQMSGYLCDLGLPAQQEKTILRCVELFEFLFTAPHGSVTGFRDNDGKMEPTFDRNDSDEQKLEAARFMQEGALDFIRDFHEVAKLLPFTLSIPPETAIRPIERVLNRPTPIEAEMLGDLTHAQGFGDVYVAEPLAKPLHRLKNIADLNKLQLQFRRSLWKEGFKRRVPDWQRPILAIVETAMNVKNKKSFM